MTRGLQRALLMLAVFVVGLLGSVFLLAGSHQQHRHSSPIVLPSLQDPAHLAAARALVGQLSVPAEAQGDPYASACRIETTFCVTSTTLTEMQLVGEVVTEVTAAGAREINRECHTQVPVRHNCIVRFDHGGTKLEIDAGPTPYVAVVPSDVGPPGTRPSASTALGPWSLADPLPAGWVTTAICEMTMADGCHNYETDLPNERNRRSVRGSLSLVYEKARQSLVDNGFLVGLTRCAPPTDGTGACMVGGFQFRTRGGKDGESVQVILRAVDRANVTVEARVNAG